jgi:microcin C transport system permease protein
MESLAIDAKNSHQGSWRKFKRLKRGYFSFVLLSLMILMSCFGELMFNSKALLVQYQNELYWPVFSSAIEGKRFGLAYEYETNYRQLKKHWLEENTPHSNFVILPIVPFNATEVDLKDGAYPPLPPSMTTQHYLGTDTIGRDVLVRLVYGFRTAMFFAITLLIVEYFVGVLIGCFMGFLGGGFDLFFQRIIEVWSNIPFLYIVMIMSSLITPGFWSLVFIMALFGWMSMTWYMRSASYKEANRDYVLAAKMMGASNLRIICKHIIPNTVSTIITFVPFSVAGGITALTALDFLSFGLPAPSPSWGELLKQGVDNLDHPWIISSVVISLSFVLMLVTFIGEAIREVFDPKHKIYYE